MHVLVCDEQLQHLDAFVKTESEAGLRGVIPSALEDGGRGWVRWQTSHAFNWEWVVVLFEGLSYWQSASRLCAASSS